jgi:four helix bundle protein
MRKFQFLEWAVYKEAKLLIILILKVARRLPNDLRFSLGSQLIRAALSIALNIAEGSGKSSRKELNRFLEIALGSTYETLAAVDILKDSSLISAEEYEQILSMLYSISNQLGGFKKKLTG